MNNVTCVTADGVAEVTLNRPTQHNALDLATFDDLIEIGLLLREDATKVRAVVLVGAGPSFCTGLDWADLQVASEQAPHLSGRAIARGQHAARVWSALPVPVIAAVHGAALGVGLRVALSADIRIAAPDAHLSAAEIEWGTTPGMPDPQGLPALVGADTAAELTTTGRVVTGVEAARLGLVTAVRERPLEAARGVAAVIASKGPATVPWDMLLLDMGGGVKRADALRARHAALTDLVGSPERAQAVQARLARRLVRAAVRPA